MKFYDEFYLKQRNVINREKYSVQCIEFYYIIVGNVSHATIVKIEYKKMTLL